MFGYKRILTTDGNDPDRRVGLVVRSAFGLAGLVFVAVAAALLLAGAQGIAWLLPLVIAGVVLALMLHSLSVPSWAVNVPDNEVWLVIDADNHVERFIGPGVHRIRPAQRVIVYPDKGLIEVPAELDRVMTADHFAYRVRVRMRVVLDPLQAEHSKFALLRTMTRDSFITLIYDDVVAVVIREFRQRQRAQIDIAALTAVLEEALGAVIADHRGLGISLAARHGITIELIPPDAIIAARTEQWVRQTESETHTSHIAGLLSTAEDHNLSPGELGALHFAVNPPSGMQVNLNGDHGLFAPGAPVRRQTPDSMPVNAPPPPAIAVPPPPLAALPAPPAPDPNVIETEQTDDGTYIPSNPIRPRKKR